MGDAKFWKEYIESYDKIFASLDYYQELLNMHLTSLEKSRTVLESCAGSGNLSVRLLKFGKIVYAIDQNAAGLDMICERAKEYRHNLELVLGDAENLFFKDESFDGVSSMLALPFMKNPIKYLREHARVLKKGGIMVLSGPSNEAKDFAFVGQNWISNLKQNGLYDNLREAWEVVFQKTNENIKCHVPNWYSINELSEILEAEAGLRVISAQENPLYMGRGYVISALKK